MVRHDPLLVRELAREIGGRWGRARVDALALAAEPRVAELRFRDAASLLFLLHPEEGAILASPPVLPGERVRFRKLFLGEASAPPDERLLLLPLRDGSGRERHRIAVELHTNQWNLLLLDSLPVAERSEEDEHVHHEGPPAPRTLRIRACLWRRETAHRRLVPGAEYTLPPGDRAFATAPPSWEEWRAILEPVLPGERRRAALRRLAWTSSLNVERLLGSAVEEPGPEPLRRAFERYRALRDEAGSLAGGETGGSAWLLERRWGPQPYPVSLDEPDARPFPSLLAAMEVAAGGREAVERRTREIAVATGLAGPVATGPGAGRDRRAEALRLRRALLARRKRLKSRRAALERELERGSSADELRALGHLLLARLREVPRGSARVVLRDFDGSRREIELDPALGPAENAEVLFDEAARRERAQARVPEELEATDAALAAIEEGIEALEALGEAGAEEAEEPQAVDAARLEALWELAGGRAEPGGDPDAGEERLPYLRYRSSGGLEIRVGRSARANDELTFHRSSPEDVWLHARQVRGAHVILRWGRKDENPPRRDLLEAAVAAAVHSDARHSGTAAVDWTRRKHVRKPRKAPPGAVLPDRVQTLFVEPDAELLGRMRLEG